MLLRSSRGAGRLLNCRFLPAYREKSLFLSPPRHHNNTVFAAGIRTSALNHSPEELESDLSRTRNDRVRRDSSRQRGKGETVTLDVDALGKPGEIVVVPHRERRPRREPSTAGKETKTTKAEETDLPFFLNELETHEAPLYSSDVNQRIEDFRLPHQPRDKLNTGNWEDLRSRIESAFTQQQLLDYILGYGQNESPLPEDEVLKGANTGGVWRPGTSAFLETGSASQACVATRVAESQYLKRKTFFVERILRDCWQLGVIDEVGQLDIFVPPHSIPLLVNSRHFSLQELAGLHEAKIDVTQSLGLVRVTGSQRSCETVREVIQDVITRIQEEDVELYPPGVKAKDGNGRVLTPEFMDWINETYGVACEEKPRHEPSKIYYLAENKQEADKARRTLNLAAYEKAPAPTPFCTYMPASEPVNVYSVDPEYNTSWFDRGKQWFRWAKSSTQTAEAEILEKPVFDNQQTRLSDELLELLRDASPVVESSGGPPVRVSLTAAVGRCLFNRKQSFDETTVSASELGKMALPRTFTTDIPRVTSFMRLLTPFPSRAFEQSHIIRLIPSAAHANILPQFEFEVTNRQNRSDAGSRNEVTVYSAKAILAENSADYLLPECGLDLRFTRSVYKDLLEDIAEFKGAETFFTAVHSRLQELFAWRKVPLPLPPFCHIPVPKDLLKGPLPESSNIEAQSSDENTPEGNEDANDFVIAEYMFPPFNHIHASRLHNYDFHGERLCYRFYESGPFLPHRITDVFISMDVTGENSGSVAAYENISSQEDILKSEFNSFYNTACKLAFELDRVGRKDYEY